MSVWEAGLKVPEGMTGPRISARHPALLSRWELPPSLASSLLEAQAYTFLCP